MADSTLLLYNTTIDCIYDFIRKFMSKKCVNCKKELVVLRKDRVPRFCSGACSLKINRKNPEKFWGKQSFEEMINRLSFYFEKHVIRKQGCWGWKGHLNGGLRGGYGILSMHPKLVAAHRVSWLIHNGEIPEKTLVLHSCDNRSCTNPEHLKLGTHKDNADDKYNRGRDKHPKGENHIQATLSNQTVREIKTLLRENKKSVDIAKIYNTTRGVIDNIKYNKSWRCVK